MRHYRIEDWADFLRGVGSAELSAEMRVHLEAGCEICSASLAMCRDLQELLSEDLTEEPSENAQKLVKASFAAFGFRACRSGRSGMASLMFDGALEPVPVGFRSSGAIPRQMLYRLEEFEIDLRMEPVAGMDRTIVTGQVLDRTKSRENLAEIPILLSSDGEIVGWTLTNEFGEFQFECSAKNDLRIMVGLEHEESILIPVAAIAAPERLRCLVGPVGGSLPVA